jgi:putative transposase
MEMQDAFLRALENVRIRFKFCVFGYVVMPEHVHLLLSEPDDNQLGRAIQLLKTEVSLEARKRGKRAIGDTPFWQARYYDHNVRNHQGFVTQLRYIHRNPVKRGLCLRPEDYRWSSFRAWGRGEIDIVEVECEMVKAQTGLSEVRGFPPFSQKT